MTGHLMLLPSLACPAQCAYCFGPRSGDGAVLSRDTLEAVVDWQQELGGGPADEIEITFHGGEPLVAGAAFYRMALPLLRDGLAPRRVRFAAQSNLWLLDRRALRALRRAPRVAGHEPRRPGSDQRRPARRRLLRAHDGGHRAGARARSGRRLHLHVHRPVGAPRRRDLRLLRSRGARLLRPRRAAVAAALRHRSLVAHAPGTRRAARRPARSLPGEPNAGPHQHARRDGPQRQRRAGRHLHVRRLPRRLPGGGARRHDLPLPAVRRAGAVPPGQRGCAPRPRRAARLPRLAGVPRPRAGHDRGLRRLPLGGLLPRRLPLQRAGRRRRPPRARATRPPLRGLPPHVRGHHRTCDGRDARPGEPRRRRGAPRRGAWALAPRAAAVDHAAGPAPLRDRRPGPESAGVGGLGDQRLGRRGCRSVRAARPGREPPSSRRRYGRPAGSADGAGSRSQQPLPARHLRLQPALLALLRRGRATRRGAISPALAAAACREAAASAFATS